MLATSHSYKGLIRTRVCICNPPKVKERPELPAGAAGCCPASGGVGSRGARQQRQRQRAGGPSAASQQRQRQRPGGQRGRARGAARRRQRRQRQPSGGAACRGRCRKPDSGAPVRRHEHGAGVCGLPGGHTRRLSRLYALDTRVNIMAAGPSVAQALQQAFSGFSTGPATPGRCIAQLACDANRDNSGSL